MINILLILFFVIILLFFYSKRNNKSAKKTIIKIRTKYKLVIIIDSNLEKHFLVNQEFFTAPVIIIKMFSRIKKYIIQISES